MKNKNIAFLSIFDLTKLFFSITERLKADANFFWITTNEYWTDYLLNEGVPKERILELVYSESDFLDEEEKAELEKEMVEMENKIGLTIHQCLIMDRFIMYQNRDNINEYVFLYYKNIKQFLRTHEINLVIGEPTTFNELMAYMISEAAGIDFIAPWHMRYPSDRIIFTKGYLNHELVRFKNIKDREKGEAFFKKYQKEISVPSYFKLSNAEKILDIGRILKSVKNRLRQYRKYSTTHLTHHPLIERIGYKLRRTVNSFVLRRIYSYPKLEDINTRIAFYGIHVQPEQSIDVFASYFSDQIKLIKDMRRALPFDFTLVVKEHPNELGAKKLEFYKSIKRIPGVKLISHANFAFDIYKKCDLVLTVSGTTAYEAGMLGIPAIMFSPVYFNSLSTIVYCSDISELKEKIETTVELKQNMEHDTSVMQDLFENSWEAYWCDPYADPTVMDESNVTKLAEGLRRILEVNDFSNRVN